jgi:hypothetical protein
MDTREKNPLMVPRGWMQAAAIVLIFGFFILGLLTYYTYNDEPPIPNVVKSANGSTPPARTLWQGSRFFCAMA